MIDDLVDSNRLVLNKNVKYIILYVKQVLKLKQKLVSNSFV